MVIDRHAIGDLLRRTGLLPAAYRITATLDGVRNYPSRRAFSHDRPEFALPPAKLLYETQGSGDPWRHYLGGQAQAGVLLLLAYRHLASGPLRICDWGCGSGRVIRHFPLLASDVTAYGTDYSADLIRWCENNIDNVTFRHNGLEPPLPFPDDSFDFLYSGSVFTHLPPELQRAWLTDQLRVVRPGGVVGFSVHGDAYHERLLPGERAELDRDGVVVREGFRLGMPWYTTYQRPAQVRRDLIGGLEVLEADLRHQGRQQDFWTLRVPARVPEVTG